MNVLNQAVKISKLKLILAVDDKGGLAKEGKIPWTCPEDLSLFKELTKDQIVVMGRKTFESLPGLLSNRVNIIVGTGHSKLESVRELLLTQTDKQIWLIGGPQLATELKDEIAEIYLSVIPGNYKCDLFLPDWMLPLFQLITRVYLGHNLEFYYISKWAASVFRKTSTFTCFKCVKPNPDEADFQALIRRIALFGDQKIDRTKVGTLSVFGAQLTFSLENNIFPVLTLRRSFIRGIFEELMWFLRGQTDAKILADKGVKIWLDNSKRETLDALGLYHLDEGDCGPIYSHQWRHWGATYINCHTDYTGKGYDQIAAIIHEIKTNPSSRRLILNGWNCSDLKEICLPPCHTMYQFEVRSGKLSCHLYQRSSDCLLAGHWNITSASLLTVLLASVCQLQPGKLIVSYGDVHIYLNHTSYIEEHLSRPALPYPKLYIKPKSRIEDYEFTDLCVEGYVSYPSIPLDMNV